MEPMSTEGQRRLGTAREQQGTLGVMGVWDPPEQPGQTGWKSGERVGTGPQTG